VDERLLLYDLMAIFRERAATEGVRATPPYSLRDLKDVARLRRRETAVIADKLYFYAANKIEHFQKDPRK